MSELYRSTCGHTGCAGSTVCVQQLTTVPMTDQPVPAAERICADCGRVIGPLDWPRAAIAPTAPAGLRERIEALPRFAMAQYATDEPYPDPDGWIVSRDDVLAAIASRSEEPELDEATTLLREAIERDWIEPITRTTMTDDPWNRWSLAARNWYARLAKEPGS
jgi:hypothetical protein